MMTLTLQGKLELDQLNGIIAMIHPTLHCKRKAIKTTFACQNTGRHNREDGKIDLNLMTKDLQIYMHL